MKRFALLIITVVAAVGLSAIPAHAVVVATCGGTSVVVGDTCHVQFTSDGFGYFMNLKPGAGFTGQLTATESSFQDSFSIKAFYIAGNLVTGQDSFLHDLGAGVWTLTVKAGTPSLGKWAGTIEAGPF